MSSSKTSSKPAAGAAKGIDKAAIRKVIAAQRALPGAKNSAKFATRKQKRKYINHKRDALKIKQRTANNASSFKRMLKRHKIQKKIRADYKKKVEQAAKENKPAPRAPYTSKAEKRMQAASAKKKTAAEQREVRKKARKAAAEAFVKSLGPKPEKAFLAKGRQIPAELLKSKPNDSKPLSKRQLKFQKNHALSRSKAANLRRSSKAPVYGSIYGRQLARSKSNRGALTLNKVVKAIEKGQMIRKPSFQRNRDIKAKVKANNAKAHKAAVEKRGGKPAKVHPKVAARREKLKAIKEKKAKKWEKKLSAIKALHTKRSADKLAGQKLAKLPKKPSVKKPFRRDKKIHIVNLDRVERSFKKMYTRSAQKLRSSIKPGTVVILLKGKYAGRRVVFLRQLPISRDLLVTGPFAVNGVPLYRIPQSFVIATSARIDIKNMPNLKSNKLSDSIFRTQHSKKANPLNENKFFNPDTKKKAQPNLHRKPIQKTTDKFLIPIIKKTPLLKEYLQASFSLSDKDAPHRMKF